MSYKVLAMNFGSTSTKVASYEGDKEVMIQTFRHTNEEMANIHNMEENARGSLRSPSQLKRSPKLPAASQETPRVFPPNAR